jgi:hypothetical protein
MMPSGGAPSGVLAAVLPAGSVTGSGSVRGPARSWLRGATSSGYASVMAAARPARRRRLRPLRMGTTRNRGSGVEGALEPR